MSWVLNGHPGVNAEMRERVLSVADALGYERPASQRPALGEAGFLLVVRDIEEDRPQMASFWADVLYGAELEARSVGPGSSSGRCTGWTGTPGRWSSR